MIRPVVCGALVSLLILAVPAHAEQADQATRPFTVTGGITLVSQYRFRGVSLSDEDPALQGTLNVNHKSGLYAGVCGSNLKGFGELGGGNLELDLYGGWRGEIAHGVTLDGGLLYYAYPGSKGGDFEFFEPYAKVSGALGPVNATVGAAYAWGQDALGGKGNLYLFNDNALPIKGTPISLTTHIGHSSGGSGLAAGSNYWDWSLGAAASWRNLTFGAAYVDTDIRRSQAFGFGATPNIVDGTVVLSLGASF